MRHVNCQSHCPIDTKLTRVQLIRPMVKPSHNISLELRTRSNSFDSRSHKRDVQFDHHEKNRSIDIIQNSSPCDFSISFYIARIKHVSFVSTPTTSNSPTEDKFKNPNANNLPNILWQMWNAFEGSALTRSDTN